MSSYTLGAVAYYRALRVTVWTYFECYCPEVPEFIEKYGVDRVLQMTDEELVREFYTSQGYLPEAVEFHVRELEDRDRRDAFRMEIENQHLMKVV